MQAIELIRLTVHDSVRIAARADLHKTVQRHDLPDDLGPSRQHLLAQLAFPLPGGDHEYWLAYAGGELVGEAEIYLPTLDNPQNATVEVIMHPGHRRLGIGRQLALHTFERARANGRRTVLAEVHHGRPGPAESHSGGVALAESLGATCAQVQTRRRLDVTTVERDAIARLLATATEASPAYHVVHWLDRVPDEVLDGVASLETRMVSDAPMGDLVWEPEQFDAARWREMERAIVGRGRRMYGCASVHTATSEVTGYTMCALDDDLPEQAHQWATIVLPEHRGHRLGLRLKAANQLRLQNSEPVRMIDTWNAAENLHMIAVNDALGFRELDTWSGWQIELS